MEVEKLYNAIKKARDEASTVGLDRITVPFKEVGMLLDILERQIPHEAVECEDDDIFAWSPDDVEYHCDLCGKEVFKPWICCPECGQAVKWE